MKRFIFPLLVFAGLLSLLGVSLGRSSQELPSPLIGKPAPAFRLAQLEAPEKQLTPADLKGQVWVFNVFASWCTACRVEHPLLLELAKQPGVTLVGLDYMDTREAGSRWLARHGNPYRHVVLDAEGKVGIDYGVYGVPETFVVDRQGVVRLKQSGQVTPEFIEQKLLPLLRELQRG